MLVSILAILFFITLIVAVLILIFTIINILMEDIEEFKVKKERLLKNKERYKWYGIYKVVCNMFFTSKIVVMMTMVLCLFAKFMVEEVGLKRTNKNYRGIKKRKN